jgi:hypothetical protein
VHGLREWGKAKTVLCRKISIRQYLSTGLQVLTAMTVKITVWRKPDILEEDVAFVFLAKK